MFYLIRGVFFESNQAGIGRQESFHGVFSFEKKRLVLASGVIEDRYGYATITNITLTPRRFEFTKVYHDRPKRALRYKLIKKKSIWIGVWQHQTIKGDLGIDGGYANCLTIQIPEKDYSQLYLKPQTQLPLPTNPWTI